MVFDNTARMFGEMSPARPRVHVIGAGAMGARHVRVFSAAGAEVTVEDVDPARADDVAARFSARSVGSDGAGAMARAHLVVVATPTITHERVTHAALDAGAHVLVEKPLASTLPAAEAVVRKAAAVGRFVFVGMSERFHPVVRALRARIAPREIASISCRRFGPGSATQPALLNLGVHDVDLTMHLTGAELALRSARPHGTDGAQLRLARVTDARASDFTLVSGAAANRDRRITVELTSGETFHGDLLVPSLRLESARGAEIVDLHHDPQTGEPLLLQAQATLAALRTGDPVAGSHARSHEQLASAADGVRTLRIVEEANALMTSASRSSRNVRAVPVSSAGSSAYSQPPPAEKL